MENSKVAQVFRNIASILEIKGGNVFRIRAYQRAAQNIESLSEDIEDVSNEGRLREIPGIGEDLSNAITELVNTGKLKTYENLKKTIPSGLLELLNIPSVGPKTVKLLYQELKIKDIPDLEKAIAKNRLLGLTGIKEKTIQNIQHGIEILKRGKERMPLGAAVHTADVFISALKRSPWVKKISPAGSLRRRKETVRDIDILVVSEKPTKVIEVFTQVPGVRDVLAQGDTKASVRTNEDIQVDLRVVEPKSFGAALLYFTGSKNFNIKLRVLGQKKNLKLNEYGIFRGKKYLAGKTEEEALKLLGLPYIEPELREDNGEIELAAKGKLPELITLADIKGDLHTHSEWSDGNNSIEEMSRAAMKRGYSYIAVTDHSVSLRVARGLDTAALKKKKAQIDKINKNLKGFRILFGTEVEIDAQGQLDYKDEVLKGFDVVVAAIHSGFKQPKDQLTRRIIKACQNKYVHIIAHPTGRLWGVRDAYELDFDAVLKAAIDTNTHLEVNSFSQRLDLNDINCRRAKEAGVKIAVSTDSHITEQLDMMQLGISVARRGWLGKEDVINTLSLNDLLKEMRK